MGARGMDEVYRARDRKLNRDVAIKLLPAALAIDAQYMTCFEREAQMPAAVIQPNIATGYSLEQGALVVELVEVADLQGAADLGAAHEKGIIHGPDKRPVDWESASALLKMLRPRDRFRASLTSRRVAVALFLLLTIWTIVPAATIQATIDTDEHAATPVPHRYIHGVIPDDAKFQLALPDNWNGKLAIASRGFSGTELTTGSFKTAALQKGYAFASSDEGWNRLTIATRPQDSYYESRQRIRELTLYVEEVLVVHYGRGASRTLMMGGSNGGHHTKWMVESYPDLYDGGIAGYGFNSQVSQWGSIATVLRNYDVIASRIDDIIQKRMADPRWDPLRTALTPPLTPEQLGALHNIYDIPVTLQNGFKFNVGRWKGSEAQWKSQYNALLGYLRDSMPRFDETFHPNAGSLTDADLKLWDPTKSPNYVQKDLRKLDLSGDLKRPIIIMHGTSDAIVSPGEAEGYFALVERRLGRKNAEKVLAIYYIPGMGHGGKEYDNLIGEQIEALEQWIDYRKSNGKKGALPPESLGGYSRELTHRSVN